MLRYQITDGSIPGRRDVDFIQVRNRELTARPLAELVRDLMRKLPAGPLILVNDRADVAVACGAAGVHLRSGSVSPKTIKRLGRLIVTVACHNEAEVMSAAGADYLLLSPVFAPLSKTDEREPLGLGELERLVRISPAPIIALGGITEARIEPCISAGAVGVAGISLFR
ncbi:MAG: thiamine phosphate synthase [Terriglobia bacterium]